MCNSEDLDVSLAISFILCVQREKEDHRFAPKLQRAMPGFIAGKEAYASPTTAELSPGALCRQCSGWSLVLPLPAARAKFKESDESSRHTCDCRPAWYMANWGSFKNVSFLMRLPLTALSKVFSHKNIAFSLWPAMIMEEATTYTCAPVVLQVLVPRLGKVFWAVKMADGLVYTTKLTYGSGTILVHLSEMHATKGANSLLFSSVDVGMLIDIAQRYIFWLLDRENHAHHSFLSCK